MFIARALLLPARVAVPGGLRLLLQLLQSPLYDPRLLHVVLGVGHKVVVAPARVIVAAVL